jgi:hypothetical protein
MSNKTSNPKLVLFVDDIVDIRVEKYITTSIVYIDMSIQSAMEPEEQTFTFVFSPEQIQEIKNIL